MLFMFLIYIVAPGWLVWFYMSRHVRATCEYRDPQPRWTDACPVPVLGVSLFMGFFGVASLSILVYGYLPVFTTYLTGPAAAAVALVGCLVCLYLARAAYRRQLVGWWGSLIVSVLFYVSSAVHFTTRSMEQVMRDMRMPEVQIGQIAQMDALDGPLISISMGVWTLVCVVYLLWVKQHFIAAPVDDMMAPAG